MTMRGRVERLERHKSAGGPPCPDCGWDGKTLTVNEYVDAAGRTVRLEDWQGNQLPSFPKISSCDLCSRQIKFVVVLRPAIAADGSAHIHESA